MPDRFQNDIRLSQRNVRFHQAIFGSAFELIAGLNWAIVNRERHAGNACSDRLAL